LGTSKTENIGSFEYVSHLKTLEPFLSIEKKITKKMVKKGGAMKNGITFWQKSALIKIQKIIVIIGMILFWLILFWLNLNCYVNA
jgi:hypothetical protein